MITYSNTAIAVESTGVRLALDSDFELSPSDLTILAGEKVAVVGHNGSGKSLLLETLLGLRTPDEGTITLLNTKQSELRSNPATRRQIGAQLQNVNFPGAIRVSEIARIHAAVYGAGNRGLFATVGMGELIDKEYRTLSRGQKQRVQIYLALAHRPKLVFLDEPTLGLDESFARGVREYWSGPEMRDCSMFIISHVPADLAVADRLICMANGKIVDEGTLPQLLSRHVGQYRGRILCPISAAASAELLDLRDLVGAVNATNDNLTVYGGGNFEKSFLSFIDRHDVKAFSFEPSRAEDLLAELTDINK